MKKLSLFLATLFSVTSIAALAGCVDGGKDSAASSSETEAAAQGPIINFYDFESTKRNISQMRPFQSFGVIAENADEKYVSEGKGSLKIQPMGAFGQTTKPYLMFPTYFAEYDYNFMDFTKYRSFSGDFYNAEEKPVQMDIGLATTVPTYLRDISWTDTTVMENVILQPGWNKVTYVIQHDLIDMFADLTSIFGVVVAFDNINSLYAKDAPTLYVDNLKLEELSTPHVVGEKSFELDKDDEKGIYEVVSFEKDYQKYAVWCGRHRNKYMHPDYEIFNPLLGDEIGNVLRFKTRYTPSTEPNYIQTYIAGELIRQYDTKAMKEDANYDYYLCMDFYNNSDALMWFRTEFCTQSENNSTAIAKAPASATWGKINVDPHTWSTYEQKLNGIEIKTTALDGSEKIVEYLDDPGNVFFIYGDHYQEGERREFWLDNVRIEKRPKAV